MKLTSLALGSLMLAASLVSRADDSAFRPIFNGRDLTGWYGLNPHLVVKLKDEKKAEALKKMRDEFAADWKVENGELVNDGNGAYLTTDEDLGDFELLIEYKTDWNWEEPAPPPADRPVNAQ